MLRRPNLIEGVRHSIQDPPGRSRGPPNEMKELPRIEKNTPDTPQCRPRVPPYVEIQKNQWFFNHWRNQLKRPRGIPGSSDGPSWDLKPSQGVPEDPQAASHRPQAPPRRSQGHPRISQDASRRPQGAPKASHGRAKDLPKPPRNPKGCAPAEIEHPKLEMELPNDAKTV